MKLWYAIFSLLLALAVNAMALPPHVVVLGIGQDAEVPHPFVTETMSLLSGLPAKDRRKIFFIHFNHTNPLVQGDKKKSDEVRSKGFGIAAQGQRIGL